MVSKEIYARIDDMIWLDWTSSFSTCGRRKGFQPPASMDACISADAAPELLGPAARNLNLSPTRVQRS